MTIHYAPWNRWFRTHWLKGSHSYELQVGPHVFYLRHDGRDDKPRFVVNRDPFWRR